MSAHQSAGRISHVAISSAFACGPHKRDDLSHRTVGDLSSNEAQRRAEIALCGRVSISGEAK